MFNLTNYLFGNTCIPIYYHAWLASIQLLQMHGYMLELFRLLGVGELGLRLKRHQLGVYVHLRALILVLRGGGVQTLVPLSGTTIGIASTKTQLCLLL